ncbi:MAG: helix-turn-helix domain-containing protein [Clostridia bacterium]|nr:helix-turn-helix domain-containing protein [Clostridia bacterium]
MILHQQKNSIGNYTYNVRIYETVAIPSHIHKNYEMIYVIEGSVELVINGALYNVYAGFAMIIPSYFIHSVNMESSKVWIAVFSADFISSFVKTHGTNFFSPFRFSEKAADFLENSLFIETTFELFHLKACLYLVCNECLNNSHIIHKDNDLDFIQKVVEYTSQNLCYNISMKDICTHLGYEYHYFSTLFHRHFSLNFNEFVNMYRYNIACELLLCTDNDVSQIAHDSGFGSIRNFNRSFKRLSGMTPTEYRKHSI